MGIILKSAELKQTIPPHNVKKKSLFSLILLAICLSVIVAFVKYAYNKIAISEHLNTLTLETESLVKARFSQYESGLQGARGVIVGAGVVNINRALFEHYMDMRPVEKEFPGARGFGFIRKVPIVNLGNFVAAAKLDGAPDFSIRTIQPHYDTRFIIQYIYPEYLNQGATGLDIASENNRKKTALMASRAGITRLTAPITLVQALGSERQGFLALLAVYDPAIATNSEESREAATIGWIYTPLVVEEVLADLGMEHRGVKFSLQDIDEPYPFYINSTLSTNGLLFSGLVKRKINLLGREWILTTQNLPSMRFSLGLWSPVWVGFVSFVVLTLAVLFYVFRRTHSRQIVQNDNEHIDVRTFLTSPFVSSLTKVYLCILVLFIFFVLLQRFPEHVAEKSDSLKNQIVRSQMILERGFQEHKEDVLFLASTAPVQGLISAIDDDLGTATELDWKNRLIDIFKAYIISSSDVYQVRLISAKPNGRELVRVERKNNRVEVVTDKSLQFKGDRQYVSDTLKLDEGKVWLSDIELNYENNMLELPHRSTYRFSTPLFTNSGQQFGLLIINVNAESLLTTLAELALEDETLYGVNSKMDYVVHPDESKLFGSDLGFANTWEEEFYPSSLSLRMINDELDVWQHNNETVFSIDGVFAPNANTKLGSIQFRASASLSKLYWSTAYVALIYAALLLLIGIILICIFYFSWSETRRKQAQIALLSERQKDRVFKSLLELSPEALIICDIAGCIEIINSQTENLFGYERDKILGQHIDFLIPYYQQHPFERLLADNLESPEIIKNHSQEIYGLDHEHKEFPIEVSLSSVQLEDRLLIATSVRDISERKRIESDLRQASLNADKANKAKSSFLANMSHEIRTPLNAIIGLTYLLQDEALNKKQIDLISKVKLAGRSLLGIVNDVLDLAKIEANELGVQIGPCNIPQLLHEVQSVFLPQAESKGLELKFEVDSNISEWLMTDDKLLRQMLTNLISNAIKFTQHGHILLTATMTEEGKLYGYCPVNTLKLEVSDTGIGISEEAQKTLFQPFSQAEDDTNRSYGGTGLGLSIVKNMSLLIGADVGVESSPELGSRFWIKLPLHLPSDEEVKALGNSVGALSVLIAEDDDKQRDRLVADSKALGWRVTSVVTGAQLVNEIMRLHNVGRPIPDVLIVDWQMPELDGLQALSLIAEEMGRKSLPAVLVVSAYETDQIASLDSGNLVDQILRKPIATPELFNAVNEVVVKHTGSSDLVLRSTRTEVIDAKWLVSITVLVVDDSEINLEVVGSILERNGANVVTALSGPDAIECLSKKPELFDIVLMDIQMPTMDGLETTQIIRTQYALTELPIVALTAGTLMEERKRALDSGMNDFLTKPIEPPKLIRTIRKLVEEYRKHIVHLEGNAKTLDYEEATWPIITGLQSPSQLLDGDISLLASALQLLFQEHGNIETYLDTNTKFQNEDTQVLAAQVHKLRGSAGLIGAQSLSDAAEKAEHALRAGSENITEHLLTLGQQLKSLRDHSARFLDQYQNTKGTVTYEEITANKGNLNEAHLAAFITMLENNDISALTKFDEYVADIQLMLDEAEFEQFQGCMNQLNFEQALSLLNANLQSGK